MRTVRDQMMRDYGIVDAEGNPLKGGPATSDYKPNRPPNHKPGYNSGSGTGGTYNGPGGGTQSSGGSQSGPGGGQSGTGKTVRNGIIRGGKFVVSKSGVGTVLFFAYDTYQGGVVHAANEALWPVSELWR